MIIGAAAGRVRWVSFLTCVAVGAVPAALPVSNMGYTGVTRCVVWRVDGRILLLRFFNVRRVAASTLGVSLLFSGAAALTPSAASAADTTVTAAVENGTVALSATPNGEEFVLSFTPVDGAGGVTQVALGGTERFAYLAPGDYRVANVTGVV